MRLNSFLVLAWLLLTCCNERSVLSKHNNDNDINIHIDVISSITKANYKIDITQNDQSLKIVYTLFDSLRRSDLRKDTAFQNVSERIEILIRAGTTVPSSLNVKSSRIFSSYLAYSKDSIILNPTTVPNYGRLLQDITTNIDSLIKNGKEDHLILVNGTDVQYTVMTKKGPRLAYAHSPNSNWHPELYRLLSETLNLYRGTKHNSFLDKKRTSGY